MRKRLGENWLTKTRKRRTVARFKIQRVIMGWSIGGGVKFTTNDIFELHARLQAWRVVMVTLTRKKLVEVLSSDITSVVDRTMAKGEPCPDSPLSAAWKELEEAQAEIRKTGYRNPRYDFDFEITIMPFEGELYGIVRCEQREWLNKFMRSGVVKSFAWFDDERPSHIKAADWKERERVWKSIFDKDSRPVAHGYDGKYTVELWQLSPYRNPAAFRKQVADAINKQPFDQRVRTVAKDRVRSAQMQIDPEYDPTVNGTSNIMHVLFKAGDWLKTDEGKAAVDSEIAVISKNMVPKFEPEML